MGTSHPMALRECVLAYVDENHGHHEVAQHFRVSPQFVNDLAILRRQTGSLAPRRRAHIGDGKLAAHHQWIETWMPGDNEPRCSASPPVWAAPQKLDGK